MNIELNPKFSIGETVYAKGNPPVLRKVVRWHGTVDVIKELGKPAIPYVEIEYEIADSINPWKSKKVVPESELFQATADGFTEASGEKVIKKILTFWQTVKAFISFGMWSEEADDYDDRDRD